MNLDALRQLSPDLRKKLLAEVRRLRSERRLFDYAPYAKQRAFHEAGASHRERLFMAGNQLGKTVAGGFEAAMHATGLYPDWWIGRRFDKPTVGWAAGVTNESTRDNPQRILLGRPDAHGTGSIPRAHIIETTAARGVSEAIDMIKIRHVSGGTSIIAFKAYEKGREKWQGETLDWVWFDEEPPQDIYTEGLTRTQATRGIVWTTFTPLLGMSDVVRSFYPLPSTPARHVTQMTIDDAEHYTPEQREEIVASYPEHEREARSKGIPVLGSGRVFPVPESDIVVEPFSIPDSWAQIGGMDFGWDHPSAGVKLAWDRDADCIYVTHTNRIRQATPVLIAPTLKAWGEWLPWAWPHDGLQHDKGSGEQLADQYRKQGLKMCAEKATFEDGSYGLEAGLMEMLERMQTGRLKVFSHLADWLDEFRTYHRKDGLVVKLVDDLMSATRYGVMMRRHAITAPEGKRSKIEYPKRRLA